MLAQCQPERIEIKDRPQRTIAKRKLRPAIDVIIRDTGDWVIPGEVASPQSLVAFHPAWISLLLCVRSANHSNAGVMPEKISGVWGLALRFTHIF